MLASLASMALAAQLSFAPPTSQEREDDSLDFAARGLDATVVEEGVRARVGRKLVGWSVAIDSMGGRRYAIDLRSPAGELDSREIVLEGRTRVDRSREIASALALIIEDASRIRGFVVLEGHLGAPELDLGLGLSGGVWLLRDHLQPRVGLRWSHSWAGELKLHQFSPRLGVAAGAPLGPFWFGALVMPAIEWTWARDPLLQREAPVLSAGGELSVLAQYRHERLVVGLRTGIETGFPALRVTGTDQTLYWTWVRWLLVLEIGLRI